MMSHRETLTLPQNRIGLVYMMPDNSVWRIESWSGDEYVVRCEGSPPNCAYVDGDRQRLRSLPPERRWM